MLASHSAFAAVVASEICLVLFSAKVYTRYPTVPVLRPSRARFAWRSACVFPGMPVCARTQWIYVLILASQIVFALQLFHLLSAYPGYGSRCSMNRMAACESLNTGTFVTQCVCSVSLFLTDSRRAIPIAHSTAS